MAKGSSPQSQGRRVLMIFLVYCVVSLSDCTPMMCLCSPTALCGSYSHGTMQPICAESAIKRQKTNQSLSETRHTLTSSITWCRVDRETCDRRGRYSACISCACRGSTGRRTPYRSSHTDIRRPTSPSPTTCSRSPAHLQHNTGDR